MVKRELVFLLFTWAVTILGIVVKLSEKRKKRTRKQRPQPVASGESVPRPDSAQPRAAVAARKGAAELKRLRIETAEPEFRLSEPEPVSVADDSQAEESAGSAAAFDLRQAIIYSEILKPKFGSDEDC